jgi:hypothetical protein
MSAVRICRHAFLPPSPANFLCETLPKVATDMARYALTYNLTRVLNIVGVEPLVRYLRKDLKAARTSSENSFGSSQAAKCPPRSTSLK